MRSLKKIGVAFVVILGLSLTGCGMSSTNADEFDASSVPCTEVAEELETATDARTAAFTTYTEAEGKPSSKAAKADYNEAKDVVKDLTARGTECEEEAETTAQAKEDAATLAQCRTDAAFAYMREEGFTDNEFVVGEDRVDWDAEALHAQGAAGFRGEEEVATSREKLQESFDSDNPDLVIAANAHLAQLPDLDRSVVLDADNWEVIQITVDAEVAGNTGLNGDVQVAVGNTPAKAGDAQWFFVDSATCKVVRANFDATGKPVDPNTPEADKPVVAHRPGCDNPTSGFHKPPPPPPPPVIPPVTPPTDDSKSSDPNDYRRPGDGGKGADVGTGYRPPSTVTEPASPPAQVDSTVTNPHTGVTDSSTSTPGSQTGSQGAGTNPGAGAGSGTGTGNGGPETYPTDPVEDQGGGGTTPVEGF